MNKACDRLVTWLIDLFLSIPHLVSLLLITFTLGGGFKAVVIGVALTHWPSLARVLRAEVFQLRSAEYIEVSQRLGKSPWWIACHHILPHLFPQLLIGFVLLFPHAILHEAAVTFLGFGVSPQQPAIGIILSESMGYLSTGMWWLAFFSRPFPYYYGANLQYTRGSNSKTNRSTACTSVRIWRKKRGEHMYNYNQESKWTEQDDSNPLCVNENEAVLEIKDLSISFTQYTRGLHQVTLQMIDNINLSIHKGEVLAVIGESGSGKSLIASAILGILPQNASVTGSVYCEGEGLSPKKTAQLRGREIALIPQSINSLDPLMKTWKQISTIDNKSRVKNMERVRRIFSQLRLPSETEMKYPFQLSGGMARRVLTATAIATKAQLIIADEPTPGLDDDSLKETLGHIRQFADSGRAVMLITHDIESALKTADRIAVLYNGKIVEIAQSKDFSGKGVHLKHWYTKALWNALPQNGFDASIAKKATKESDNSQSITPAFKIHKKTGSDFKLEAKDICFGYGGGKREISILNNVNLSIHPGEVVGLFGKSGLGKTTLARILAGYEKPTKGIVRIDNRDISASGSHPVQLVFQNPEKAVNPRWRLDKTLREGWLPDDDILDELKIERTWLRRWPNELSSGQLQRLCLARALGPDTRYLIADEMTTMLDAVTQAKVWEFMLKKKYQNTKSAYSLLVMIFIC